MRAKNIPLAQIEKAGLILSKEQGGYYDRFRNRIIFPVFDIKSRVLAFGARVLDEGLPKYINSPETPVYIKGHNLYGLHLAKDSIRQENSVAIVEGYFDFIVPFQEGFKNIVASLGTALTIEQIRLLRRYTHNVVMVYDADSAGELATLRSLDMLIEEEVEVRVASLPKGFDPDLLVREKGIDAFRSLIAKAQGIFDYKLGVLSARYPSKSIEEKARIASEMIATIHKFKHAVLRSEYTKKLAEELKLNEEALWEELNKSKPAGTRPSPEKTYETTLARAKNPIHPTEKLLIKLMLEETTLISRIKDSLEPADFQNEVTARIVSLIFDWMEQGKSVETNTLLNSLKDEKVSEVLCESAFLPELSPQNRERVVQDCIIRLKQEKFKTQRQHLHEQIQNAQQLGNEEQLSRLMEEFLHLTKTR